MYVVDYKKNGGNKLYIKSPEKSLNVEISGTSSLTTAFFGNDNRNVIFTKSIDTLCIYSLYSNRTTYITRYKSLQSS